MIWYIITAISAALFFGFVIWCVCRFGMQSCYSAYGPLCRDNYKVNWWSVFTFASAVTLMPVMLEMSAGKAWQFTGFLCTVFIAFISFTPDYDKDKGIAVVHSLLAELGALWALLYIIFNATHLWWLIPTYFVVCGIGCFLCGKWTWNFWLEMVAFLSTFTAVFLMI